MYMDTFSAYDFVHDQLRLGPGKWVMLFEGDDDWKRRASIFECRLVSVDAHWYKISRRDVAFCALRGTVDKSEGHSVSFYVAHISRGWVASYNVFEDDDRIAAATPLKNKKTAKISETKK